MFLSTFEKQLDAKRRIVVPQDYRAALSGPVDGVFLFPSIRSDCLEGGGQALFDRYGAVADELEFGDELRDSIERNVFGEMQRLSFDTAGRITLPESLCEQYGLTDWVAVVGLRDRFEIWERDAYRAQRAADRERARAGLAEMRAQQRQARIGGAA
ncbi:division/cell wall cluster transcriptional repressor MraZ [Phenylobacterium sp. SCN 70-31]|uniref:division/cell wall cluster transcriptional repressor MraZ n=1 Tax=Phenylobacterium sp. SCN 70-31 TaxID=1660129 RepID=UPI00086EB2E5|nr:division/cell wall cluster transcriptional repressor MraZ [Phenylobacterium sp. SCN 70-31]ODT88394.1 MAG: cell division protein MraZ [Phenylobacterium sp. SCN 70-31]